MTARDRRPPPKSIEHSAVTTEKEEYEKRGRRRRRLVGKEKKNNEWMESERMRERPIGQIGPAEQPPGLPLTSREPETNTQNQPTKSNGLPEIKISQTRLRSVE